MLIKNKSEAFLILNFLKFYLMNGNKNISENLIIQSFSKIKKIKKTNPIWGLMGSGGQLSPSISKLWKAQTLLGTILLHGELVTFNFRFPKS